VLDGQNVRDRSVKRWKKNGDDREGVRGLDVEGNEAEDVQEETVVAVQVGDRKAGLVVLIVEHKEALGEVNHRTID
jgi:hypothetical protein